MLDRIKVSIGKTFNMGNYESLRIDVGYESDIKKSEDFVTVFDDVAASLEERLKEIEQKIRT